MTMPGPPSGPTRGSADGGRSSRAAATTAADPDVRAWRRGMRVVGVWLVSTTVVLAAVAVSWPDSAATVRSRVAGSWLDGPWFPPPSDRLAYLGIVAVVLAADGIVLGRRGALAHLVRPSTSARVDLVTWTLVALNTALALPVLLSAGLIAVLPARLQRAGPDLLGSVTHPVVRFVVVIVAVDALRYAAHRLMHRSRLLWPFHAVHHTATEFTVLTGARLHPVEYVVDSVVVTLPLALVGAGLPQLAAGIAIVRLIDLPQHSMLPWTYGWVGRWLLFSPVGHRIHHSPHRHQWDTNFGDLSPVWDRLFGTWYAGDDVNETIGLAGTPPAGVVESFVIPFGRAWHELTRGGRRADTPPLTG